MTILNLVLANSDIISLILLQGVSDLKDLGRMSLVNRQFNRLMTDSHQGRQIWLKSAVNITAGVEGFNADSILNSFTKFHSRETFFKHIRLLVCPWHALGFRLPLDTRDVTTPGDRVLFFTNGGDETRLQFQSGGPGGVGRRVSFPCRMCPGFEEQVAEDGVAWMQPKLPVHDHAHLEGRVAQKLVVPDFSHDRGCVYRFFPLHAGAFAVVEIFDEEIPGNEFVEHGVYFFSHRSGVMLRHFKCDFHRHANQCSIISRPFEMWFLTRAGVMYHGPSCDFRSDQNSIAERMDPALWMAGVGDATGAIEYMRSLNGNLGYASLISGRTLLHYAAKEGHTDAVRQLINAGFNDIDAVDGFQHTALHMAVAELHLDVIRALVVEFDADVCEGDPIFFNLGEFVLHRPYARDAERIRDEIKRIVPCIIRVLLEKEPSLAYSYGFICENISILSSPDALRLILAAERDICEGINHVVQSFDQFRTRNQEISAIHSLCVLVREFDFDIDHVDCVHKETAAVTLAKKGCAEALIAVIDYLGADPAAKDGRGRSIREIAYERSRRPMDVDGRRMLSFLDSRGL